MVHCEFEEVKCRVESNLNLPWLLKKHTKSYVTVVQLLFHAESKSTLHVIL